MERKQLCMAVCDDQPEDMERIQEAVQRTMETLGYKDTYEVHCFATGSGLYEAARKGQFHLVFLDIEMPGMDGFELASRLRLDAPGPAWSLSLTMSSLYLIPMNMRPCGLYGNPRWSRIWGVPCINICRRLRGCA